MIKDIFKFGEDDFKNHIVYENKLLKKLRFSFDYLLKYLPINTVDDKFIFSEVKFREGKNYDWFFLVKGNVYLLVRQYGSHFTFISLNKDKEISYRDRLAVFTISNDREKMDDETSDELCDNKFLTIEKILPSLIEMIEKDDVHSIWNSLSLVRPDYTDVKIAQVGDSTHSLDLLLFACDEVFGMHLVEFAENEMAVKIAEFKVGDMLGDAYQITDVNDKINKEYYYSTGLSFVNTNFPESKPQWADIYSLTRYYLEYIFPDIDKDLTEKVL
jgi:hypothetical protein